VAPVQPVPSVSGSGSSQSPVGSQLPSTPPAGTSSSTSSALAPAPASAGPANAPRCATAALVARLGDGQGAAGTLFTTVRLLNRGAAPCRLFGYPGLSLVDATGAVVVDAQRGGGMLPADPPRAVVLAPGSTAHLVFTTSDVPDGTASCPTVRGLLVTPPDERVALRLPVSAMPCRGEVHVGPVQAGPD
jgi:ABC-type Fe3+-hydroxamate transport system substrate-binding protein